MFGGSPRLLREHSMAPSTPHTTSTGTGTPQSPHAETKYPRVAAGLAAITQSHEVPAVPICRWGDGPLRWIQCLLFLDLEREVHQFTDFFYEHYDYTYNKKIVCRGCAHARVVG